MKTVLLFAALLQSAFAVSAEEKEAPKIRRDHVRISVERVMTGAAVGTYDVLALHVGGELFYVRSVGIGLSFRKEGNNVTDGWGIGLHASRTWFAERPFSLVGEAGVRWFIPTKEYFRFRYHEADGRLSWQRWDRPSANAWPKFVTYDGILDGGAVAPVVGVHGRRFVGPVSIRVGMRAMFTRYGVLETTGPSDGDMRVLRDDRSWRVILAPVISIGF